MIRYDENDDTASIWTASDPVFRRLLKRLGRSYLTEDGERHAIFAFPRKWLILPRFKKARESNPSRMSNLRSRIAKPPTR